MDDSVRWLKRVIDMELLRRAEAPWCPRADVYRTPTGWAIKLDVAGVPPQEVSWVILGNTLVVRGCRRDTLVQHGWQMYQMEIEYAEFTRKFEFPCDLSGANVSVQAEQGMLVIRIDVANKAGKGRNE